MNNAMVTVPLSEVDALRTKLEQAEYKASQLETTQKKVKVEISERITSYRHESVRNPSGWPQMIMVPDSKIMIHQPQYINLDDVIKTIREEEKQKVQNETAELERRIERQAATIKEQDNKYTKDTEELKATYVRDLNEAKGIKAPISEDKKLIGVLSQKLAQAMLQISDMQRQSVWGKIFHPIKPIKQLHP